MTRWTYLELSDELHHKYYAVGIADETVTLRWGRIGYPGQMKLIQLDTVREARQYAVHKLLQKRSRGYRRAIEGVRPRRELPRPRPRADHRQQELIP